MLISCRETHLGSDEISRAYLSVRASNMIRNIVNCHSRDSDDDDGGGDDDDSGYRSDRGRGMSCDDDSDDLSV